MKVKVYSSTIRRKEMDAVLTCLVDEKTGPGELNSQLVQYTKEFYGVAGAVAFRGPALALKYALASFDLPLQSKIVISALAPSWQYFAIKELGYIPQVLDVSVTNGLVEIDTIKKAAADGARLILYHETSGLMPNISELQEVGLPIIEDISESCTAGITDPNDEEAPIKKAGTFGVFSIIGLEQSDLLTAGGGALLLAPQSKDWSVLKKYTDSCPLTDKLPDINSALALVQLKELSKNELIRQSMYELYSRSLMQTKHKTLLSPCPNSVQSVFSFPVVLENGIKDVKAYAEKKEIEIASAFANSVVAVLEDESELKECINARSLLLRCVHFPLYPLLGNTQTNKIAKVLSTLP